MIQEYKKMSNSTRKFIRSQKAQIRRQFLDVKKQEEMIKEMYNKSNDKNKGKRGEKRWKIDPYPSL